MLGRYLLSGIVVAGLTTAYTHEASAQWADNPTETSICELTRHPRHFAGKHVVLTGRLETPQSPELKLSGEDCPSSTIELKLGALEEFTFVKLQRNLDAHNKQNEVTARFDGWIEWYKKEPRNIIFNANEINDVRVNGQKADLTVPDSTSAKATTVCELAAHPEQWEGRLVVLHAFFETDHMHGSILQDPACTSVGIVPVDDLSTVGQKEFDKVVWAPGSLRNPQSITARFTGIYHRSQGGRPRHSLYVTRYDDIEAGPWRDDDPWAHIYRQYHPRPPSSAPKD